MIPRKHLDRRMEGQKDGQTLFHTTLPATSGGSKKVNITSLKYDFTGHLQRNKKLIDSA